MIVYISSILYANPDHNLDSLVLSIYIDTLLVAPLQSLSVTIIYVSDDVSPSNVIPEGNLVMNVGLN